MSDIVEEHSGQFSTGGDYAAISSEDLNGFSSDDRRQLRAPDIDGITRMTLFFLIVLVGVLGLSFTQVYLLALTGQGIMKDMRLALFTHITHQSLDYLNRNPVGKLVTRVTNDVETINELFQNVLSNLIRDMARMIGVVIALFILSRRLGLVTVLTLPPVLVAFAFFRVRAREAFRNVRVWVSRVNTFLSEHLSGMGVVQMFVTESRAARRFERDNEELMKANLGEMYVMATFRPLVDLLSNVSIAVIIYFGAAFFNRGLVSLGVVIAYINYVRLFYQPVMSISEQFTILQSAMAGGERVFQILDENESIEDSGTRHFPKHVEGDVVFENVVFAYKPGEPVIRDLSFRIAAGETVAVVGYTGAGKTTIANLLTRMWDIQSGSIRIDGEDIRNVPLAELRTTVQPIQQDVFLFNETVRENIRLGASFDDARIHEVSKIVQAEPFITRLPGGYDAILNEGATNISTGQRQLLSFARVLAHDPRIIIMDEATANIDTETEQLIQNAMFRLMEGRTSLVIAHRLSTIRHADRILVLSHGQLVEEGTHEQLIEKHGLYYNLYRLQYQDDVAAD
ncbi:MAG: ABC transporter ATP-binding protein [Spirochaetaceae bacterium]